MINCSLFLRANLALAFLSLLPLEAQQLVDGSFEQKQLPTNSSVQDPTGTGWTFTGLAGLVNGVLPGNATFNTKLTAPDGHQYAYLRTNRSRSTTNNDGAIGQKVTFPTSGNYLLTVYAALRDSTAASYNATWDTYYMLEVDGVIVGGNQHGKSDGAFAPISQTFYVTAGVHQIALVSGGPTYSDTMTFIDNIQLTAAPTGAMAKLNITSVVQSMATGITSEEMEVALTDGNGLRVDAPPAGTTLALSTTSGSGKFFDADNHIIRTLQVPAGSNTAVFYYQDAVAGTPTITLSGTGLSPATQSESVVLASAVKLVHQSGTNLLDGSGNPLHLTGTNLSGWLVMEDYMSPIDKGGNGLHVADQYGAIALLDSRFGVATEQSIFKAFQSNWITDVDIQNAKNEGLNVLRVPFWWANLYTTNFEWRADAFEYLDWVVNEAAKYGMYVVLDMHGVFGGQSANIWSGNMNVDRYWETPFYQAKTDEMWKRVATHFKFNNSVLAFDLMNEPDGAPGSKNATITNAQNHLYQTVRSIDTGHLLLMELTGGSWDWSNLPSPSANNWTNVAYSPHAYPTYFANFAQSQDQIDNDQVGNATHTTPLKRLSENVPDIIGEMNWYAVQQSWVYALTQFKNNNISSIFWGLKAAAGAGTDPWGLYDMNGFAWGDPEGDDSAGPPPNGSIRDLHTPSLLTDSAQTIANQWAAFTTGGTSTMSLLPGAYPLTVTYPPNFHYNYVTGDAVKEITEPDVAIAQGLLPPKTPPANGVAGVNFGFEHPFVTNEANGGDSAGWRVNYLPNAQSVSAGWTFLGNSGLSSTGLKAGALTGWKSGNGILAPEGKQVAYLQGSTSTTSSFSQNLTSGQAGAWSITFSIAQGNGAKEGVVVTLNKTILGTFIPTSANYQTTTLVSKSTLPAGTYPLEFSVSSNTGGFVFVDNVKIVVGTPASSAPVFTSATTASGIAGAAINFTVAATNDPTDFEATGLPTGLTVNRATGLISGTTAQTGTFAVKLTAANAVGTTAQSLSLTINAPTPPPVLAPVVTSSARVTGTSGVAFAFTVTATNSPTHYTASGLPAGLSMNGSTGTITGSTTASGTFSVGVAATNSGGTGTQTLLLTIDPPIPVIKSGASATGVSGSAFVYVISATNSPTLYAASGLPTGLVLNTTTGVISGTPTSPGTSTVVLTATNAGGSGVLSWTLTIKQPVPVIESATTANGISGESFRYAVTATNSPTSYNASGLPAGLSIDKTTGIISGTPSLAGNSTVILSATNAGGVGALSLTLSISSGAPQINSVALASGLTGTPFSFTVTASHNPTGFTASGLPAGLSINGTTGVISGTPIKAGVFAIGLTASNAGGSGTQQFSLTVKQATPVITSAAGVTGTEGQALSYLISATNSPTGFGASTLPAGIMLNTATGLISGTPTTPGSMVVSVTATNAGGTATKIVLFTIKPSISQPTAPAAPTKLQASGSSMSQVTLSWLDNSNNETAFNINRAPTAVGPFTLVGSVGSNVTTFVDNALAADTAYYYQVVATNSVGDSTASNISSGVTFSYFTPNGLVAYWNLDEATGVSAQDATGHNHVGTLNGNVSWSPGLIGRGSLAFTVGGNAIANLSVADSGDQHFSKAQSFTLSAWVHPNALLNQDQGVICKSRDKGNYYGLWIDSTNHWVFRGPNGDVQGPVVILNSWQHLTAVQDGGSRTRHFYVNGVLVASGPSQDADGAGALWIGQANSVAQPFLGNVDEVRLYSRALPATEVTTLMGPPILQSLSLQNQGAAGQVGFTIPIDTTVGVESRIGTVPGRYLLSLSFPNAVSGLTASLGLQPPDAGLAVGSVTSLAYDSTRKVVTIQLDGVNNAQRLNVHLAGILPGNGTADVPFNVLAGDVDQNGIVNQVDLNLIKANYTSSLNEANVVYDVNCDGVVDASDAAIVSAGLGKHLGSVPTGWSDRDLGSVGLSGSATVVDGVFTQIGSGVDIWNQQDGLHYTYQSLSGDGTIVAHLLSQSSGQDKSGVMIREDLTADSPYVQLAVHQRNGAKFESRANPGASATISGIDRSIGAPTWFKLSRAGNVFTCFTAPDGVNWSQLGGALTLPMAGTVYIGLSETSHNNAVTSKGTFDHVSVVSNSAW